MKSWWSRVSGQPMSEWFPTKIVAVIVSIFAIMIAVGPLGWPVSGDSVQLGYRGTGMDLIQNEKAYARALATVDAIPAGEAPYPVDAGAVKASEVYENVKVLGDLSQDNFLRVMTAITQWVSPDQGCAYCHGEDGNFASDDIYAKVVSRRMIQMTQTINSEWKDHVKATGVTCYTCHRGMNVPANIWFKEPPAKTAMLGWRNDQNIANPAAASASLPAGVFERFLLEDNNIRVIPQDPRVDTTGKDIKATEWTFGLMIHMSKSLGVNCDACHNTRAMSQWDQSPPARTTAWYGIRMVRTLNNEYLTPLQPVFPPNRLGPTGDAPKLNCATCHQGVNKPLFGTSMIGNYPELAGPSPGAEKQAMLQ